MAAHARLKNEFTGDQKYHNLMRWLIFPTKAAVHRLLIAVCIEYLFTYAVTIETHAWHTKTLYIMAEYCTPF